MIYAFGDHELDEALFSLRRSGKTIRLQPKCFALLLYLIEHRERVVPKEELLEAIWPGEALTDSVLARTVATARKALGQKRGERQPIETDYGRGYRFTAELQQRAPGEPSVTETTAPARGGEEPEIHPFVGRSGELDRLLSNLDAAMQGQGRLLILAGEPGIGKTRMAEELCARARARGASIFRGRCFEGDGAPAFWPFVQVMRACADELPATALARYCGDERGLLGQLVPELLGDDAPAVAPLAVGDSELSAANQRFQLLEGLSQFLVRAGRDAPRVIFLDDLQWADEPSLQALGLLVQELGDTRLLLLGTVRQPALPHEQPVRDMLDTLIRPRASERLTLAGLDEDAIAAYAEAISGRPPPPGLAAAVREKTAGNPLFVRESLQLLLDDTGHFRAGARESAEGWRVELPEVTLDLLRQRLRGLDSELLDTLRCASVFGAEFEFARLGQVLEVDDQALLDTMGDAQAAGLIEERPGRVGAYGFSHVLLRDTLYTDLPTRQRVSWHRRIGEVLAAAEGNQGDRTGEIAHHFHRALPDPEAARAAVRFGRRAGETAMARYAFDEAALRYENALEALEYLRPIDERKRYRLLLLWGQSLGMGGHAPRASEAFFRAIGVARGLDDAELLGWAAYALALVSRIYYTRTAEVDAAIREALSKLPQDDRLLRPRLLMEAAQPTTMSAQPEMRQRLVEEAISLLDPADPETPWRTLRGRLLATAEPARIEERLDVLQQLIELSAGSGQRWIELDAKRTRYPLHLELGDIVAADRDLADCVELARENRNGLGIWFTQVARLGRAQAEGRLHDVERQLPVAVSAGHALHTPAAELLQRVHEVYLAIGRGQTGRLADVPLDLERDFAWTGESARIGSMRLLLQLGREAQARTIYEHFASSGFENVPVNEYLVVSLVGLAEAAYLLRDRTGGRRLRGLIEPLRDRIAIDALYIIEGSARTALGLLAALDHEPEAACEHFEQSSRKLRQMGLRALSAADQLYLARALLQRGGDGDRARAEALAEELAQEATELGLAGVANAARALTPL